MAGLMASCRKQTMLCLLPAILATLLRTADAQDAHLRCSSSDVLYTGSTPPLLMGGVVGSCAGGCQPRDDVWSKACDPSNRNFQIPAIRKCEQPQTQAVLEQLVSDGYEELLVFPPCELHSYLTGRTLWLIGDSLMKNYYFAIRCFMLDFWDHSLGECQVSNSIDTERAIYHAADTNISNPQGARVITDLPRCIWLLAGGRICWVHSVRGEELADPDPQEPGLLQTLYQTVAEPQDIFYINFGRWHYSNCKGLQLEPYQLALWHLGKLYEKTRYEFSNLLFKVSNHDHTACRSGQRNEPAKQCLPAQHGGYPLAVGRRVTHAAENILGRFNVPIVNIYNETLSMFFGHITDRPIPGREVDCLHYCSPGVPEFEIWSMYKALKQYGITPWAARLEGSHRSVPGSQPLSQVSTALGKAKSAAAAATAATKPAVRLSNEGSTAGAMTADGMSDGLQGLIGRMDSTEQSARSHGGDKQAPELEASPSKLTAAMPARVEDPRTQCVPVTAKRPPPGWSYYYDSITGQGKSQSNATHRSSRSATRVETANEGGLGTYMVDEC